MGGNFHKTRFHSKVNGFNYHGKKKTHFFYCPASPADREVLGLPRDWSRIQGWLDNETLPQVQPEKPCDKKPRKFPDIPVMTDYDGVLPEPFWEKFPSNALPTKIFTKVKVDVLEEKIESCKLKLLRSEYFRAKKCVQYLRDGAPAFQLKELPSCIVKNSATALKFGPEVTNVIASSVEKKYACGPFKSPPVRNFRANSLIAVPQPGKVRVCLNVSLPTGKSFNNNIIPNSLEKIQMTSAQKFGHAILRAGNNATMLKFDKADAYKNIPAKIQDLRNQGFLWGGRYFIETRQMFGSKASVQNFDVLANTVRSLVLTDCAIPKRQVLRQLDDTPAVAPEGTGWCEEFSLKYRRLCDEINLELAEPCPNFEKAFDCSKFGKVLGIHFDTSDLTWKLPSDKVDSTLKSITEATARQTVPLKEMQSLMGRLNHVSQMCPFLNSFKHPLNIMLAESLNNGSARWSDEAIRDLKVWAGFLSDVKNRLPIPHPLQEPPLCTKVFHSDAAGLQKNSKSSDRIGCGILGINETGDTMLAFQLWWPDSFAKQKTDSKGSRFGSKTATLEMIGVILPFLLIPKQLIGQHVVLKVDNLACVYGYTNHYMKGDICASILIKALHLISAFLGSVLHVEHIPRCSSWESTTADNLSRKSTTRFLEEQMLSRYRDIHAPKVLLDWLNNPTEDWGLARSLLDHTMNLVTPSV